MFISVERGVEHIDGDAEKDALIDDMNVLNTNDLPGKAVEPGDNTSEHKKLGIRCKVARKGDILIPDIRTKLYPTWRRVLELDRRVVVNPEHSLL